MTRQRWPRRSPEFRSNWAVMSFSHAGRCRNDATYAALPESAWLPLAGRAFRAENPGWVTRLTPVLCDLRGRESAGVLAGLRPAGPVEAARKTMARDIIAEVRDLDARLKKITTEMSRVLAEHGTRLTELDGIGPVVAARLLGRTGHAGPFGSSSAFRELRRRRSGRGRQGTEGPPPPTSGRGPAAQPRAACHRADPSPDARQRWPRLLRPQDRRGQDPQRGMRCLKRRLADRVWRTMIADQRSAGAEIREDTRGGSVVQRGWLNPEHQLFPVSG